MKNLLIGFTLFIALFLVLLLTSYAGPANTLNSPLHNTSDAVQQIKIPKLPESMSFAGESVPLSDHEVKERIDREILSICFWHSNIIQNIKFTKRYFPIIEELSKKYGLPDDFKYLAVTESNLRNATSGAGAKGIWQFMPATAKSYDLLVTNELDERLNFYKSTEAACKMLVRLKEKFGSWTLAAAAYNCGEGRVKDRITEQNNTIYYNLILPEETMRYVPRIIAMKEVMTNSSKYGFNFSDEDYYTQLPKYKKVTINTSINHWPDFCKEYNITYKTLIIHNPWIIGYKLTNTPAKEFEILIPE